jgi:hypothetical protein
VQDVTIFGQALHVISEAPDAAEQLWRDLSQSAVSVQKVREIEPSLEDVFVTLTKASMVEEELRLQALADTLVEAPLAGFDEEEGNGDA